MYSKLDATNSVDLNSSYYSTDSGGGEFNYAKVLINFRQLMDDVYCLDWC